jgi:hypothetical protein
MAAAAPPRAGRKGRATPRSPPGRGSPHPVVQLAHELVGRAGHDRAARDHLARPLIGPNLPQAGEPRRLAVPPLDDERLLLGASTTAPPLVEPGRRDDALPRPEGRARASAALGLEGRAARDRRRCAARWRSDEVCSSADQAGRAAGTWQREPFRLEGRLEIAEVLLHRSDRSAELRLRRCLPGLPVRLPRRPEAGERLAQRPDVVGASAERP